MCEMYSLPCVFLRVYLSVLLHVRFFHVCSPHLCSSVRSFGVYSSVCSPRIYLFVLFSMYSPGCVHSVGALFCVYFSRLCPYVYTLFCIYSPPYVFLFVCFSHVNFSVCALLVYIPFCVYFFSVCTFHVMYSFSAFILPLMYFPLGVLFSVCIFLCLVFLVCVHSPIYILFHVYSSICTLLHM